MYALSNSTASSASDSELSTICSSNGSSRTENVELSSGPSPSIANGCLIPDRSEMGTESVTSGALLNELVKEAFTPGINQEYQKIARNKPGYSFRHRVINWQVGYNRRGSQCASVNRTLETYGGMATHIWLKPNAQPPLDLSHASNGRL